MGSRIGAKDTFKDALIKMSDGNPGALTVMMDMFKAEGADAIVLLCHLDDMDIAGQYIWIAYKDVYKQNITKLCQMIPQREQFKKDLNACEAYTMARDYKQKEAAGDVRRY